MDNKQVNKAPQKSARLVLQAVTAIARSNANSLCRGLLYVYITVKMYPCSGGTDTGSPEL